MNTGRIQFLVDRYNAGVANDAELQELEQCIEKGDVKLDALQDLDWLEDRLSKMEDPLPTLTLDDKFYDMLAHQKRLHRQRFSWKTFFTREDLVPKLAFAVIALLAGFFIGFFVESPKQNSEVTTLTKEVSSLKEMMMLSLLEKESATERLRAVSLTEEMSDASSKVTKALLKTLNNDENVNVRLAALEALLPYLKQDLVREELIRSIAKQESPLVQIALAELMVSLQEKSSVKEFEKILKSEKTPGDIKKKIKESIDVLT